MSIAYTNTHAGAADILDAALALLRRDGWTQGVPYDRTTGHLDLLGSIALASGCRKSFLLEPEFPLLKAPPARRTCALHAWDTLDAILGTDPATWNDHPDRTVTDVYHLLDQGAEHLRVRAAHPTTNGFQFRRP